MNILMILGDYCHAPGPLEHGSKGALMGVCTYLEEGPIRGIMGGHFIGHPPDENVTVCPVDSEHPVCAGIEDFTVFDEHYHLDVNSEETHVFLESSSDKGEKCIASWTHSVGKGRFLGLTPGHTAKVINHPMMKKLIIQSVQWLTA